METPDILKILKQGIPRGRFEKRPFGRNGMAVTWLEAGTLVEASGFLRSAPGLELDWLENLSVAHMDSGIQATYLLRSTQTVAMAVLRVPMVIESQSKAVQLPSVASVWTMAKSFEIEAGELFGIDFVTVNGQAAYAPDQRLPKSWNGFPLRKTYVFPSEFLGIKHSRRDEGQAQ